MTMAVPKLQKNWFLIYFLYPEFFYKKKVFSKSKKKRRKIHKKNIQEHKVVCFFFMVNVLSKESQNVREYKKKYEIT